MDLGLKGRKAIVCAASKGLGRGAALALARDGVDLVICARTRETLEETASAIARETGVTVTPITCDITREEGQSAVLAACPAPDILINNAGGPPPGDFKDFDLDAWRSAVENNMLTPIALIHATVYGMAERGFGRIINITSASVKNPIPTLELSNGARAGLTGAVASLSRKVAASNVTINAVLPGLHDTARIRQTLEGRAKAENISVEQATEIAGASIPARRIGDADDFGAVCAFLCSQQAGFITGQNLLVDGGGFNATM
ncbi:MAG: SDR family oxidoreductase [Pseudomonadota bacterium]